MRVLATYNFKGGVGKTATAVNIAFLAAQAGERVLLWDLDPQGAATFTFRVKTKVRGGSEKLMRGDGVESAVRESDYDRLDVLPSDLSYRDLDILLRGKGGADTLARLVAPLAEHYDLVVFDCAPTLSSVAESVFVASDALLAPTIPTALSLRTLSRLMKHVKKRGGRRPRVLPFFCMVDRRKALHRRVCDWARAEGLGFLETEIPYSSAVEKMSVRREPLDAFARSDRAARAYRALYEEVAGCIADGGGGRPSRRGVEALYERALERNRTGAATVPRTGGRSMGANEIEFKLRLDGEVELEALARAAERRGARRSGPVEQENHFFDTGDAALRASGIVVRLRREDGRYVLAVKGARVGGEDGNVHVRPEEECRVPAQEAEEILQRRVMALASLATSFGANGGAIAERLRDAAQAEELVHVGSFRNLRLRLEPLDIPGGGALTLELDRTELPGGRVDHELELEVTEEARAAGQALLGELLREAAVVGQPSTSKAKRFFEALAGRG